MASPNYQYEKRQRDLAKKKKKEEKARRKAERAQAARDGRAVPEAGEAAEPGADMAPVANGGDITGEES